MTKTLWHNFNFLGNISVGNLTRFLPFVLKEIEEQPKLQYLLLHSLKEVRLFREFSLRCSHQSSFTCYCSSFWTMSTIDLVSSLVNSHDQRFCLIRQVISYSNLWGILVSYSNTIKEWWFVTSLSGETATNIKKLSPQPNQVIKPSWYHYLENNLFMITMDQLYYLSNEVNTYAWPVVGPTWKLDPSHIQDVYPTNHNLGIPTPRW